MHEPHSPYHVRIYYEDTDAGGVVYYANYLKFAERARTEWLRSLGYEQRNLWQSHGIGFVVKQCHAEYHAPAYLDDVLSVDCAVVKHTRSTITMRQHIMRETAAIVTLNVVLVCVNAALRPVRLPETLLCNLVHLG